MPRNRSNNPEDTDQGTQTDKAFMLVGTKDSDRKPTIDKSALFKKEFGAGGDAMTDVLNLTFS